MGNNFKPFKARNIKFSGVWNQEEWCLKVYSISPNKNNTFSLQELENLLEKMTDWLARFQESGTNVHKIGVLMLHEATEGRFVIINSWTDENMLQHYVYLQRKESSGNFECISDKGLFTCVWEMEVLWYERNLWIKEVMARGLDEAPRLLYLNTGMNTASQK